MTRAFYPAARSHHAFCMAIDFGMKFKKRNGFWSPEGLLGITGSGDYRIEVADESMDLLEPQVKDDCLFKPHRYGQIEETKHQRRIGTKYYLVVKLDGFYEEASCFEKIIQRDGKPFFWPELVS